MMDIIEWRKNKNFNKEKFPRFMSEVAKQVEKHRVTIQNGCDVVRRYCPKSSGYETGNH